MARVCLNVLVGIPASGKTTYCQQLSNLPDCKFNVVHVCYDTFINIESRFEDFSSETGLYKACRQKLLSSVEAIIFALKQNDSVRLSGLLARWYTDFESSLELSDESSDFLFLIDDNNYYRSMRWEWAKLARKLSLGFFITYFETSLQESTERNEKRNNPVPPSTITRMCRILEKPCGKLFRWEQRSISIYGQIDMDSILSQVHHCLENPETPSDPTVALVPQEQSKVHKLDISLRKAVAKRIALVKDSITKQEVKAFAGMLQERKMFILEQMRNGEQNVSDELLPSLVEELF